MSLLIVAAKKTSLKSPLAAADTSVVLREFVDRDGNALAMASFGEFGTIVIKQGEVWELIKFSGITQDSPSTGNATLTVASSGRSLLPISPYTGASTGEDFSAGAEVIVTNDPYIMSTFANKENAETFNEVITFGSLPQTTAGNPLSANDLARKAYVDTVVLGTLTTINVIVPGTAGATIADGNLIYYDDSTNTWKLCDADTAATVDNVLLGIAQGAGTNGVAITGGVLLQGVDDAQSGLTEGQTYYAGNTAGAIQSTPGTTEVTIGIGKSATSLYFAPRFDQVLTEDQQDAFAGTEGTPSASNKFHTATGAQKQTPIYGASVVGTDSYAITVTPAVAAYVAGMRFTFKADVANTGAATLAVGSGGAKAIKKLHDQDLATGDIEAGQIIEVAYDAASDVWQMQSQLAVSPSADVQTFTATGAGTWTKPSGAKKVFVQMWGGGGSGGAQQTGASNPRAGGGGGGGYSERLFDAADLGATEAVSVAAGGAAKSASTGSGNVGGNSTFGTVTKLTAYGGGGGNGSDNGTAQGGGGGGSALSVGGVGGNAAAGAAGDPTGFAGAGSGAVGYLGGGGGLGQGGNGGNAYYGGGGGGGSNGTTTGGSSVHGGAGGAGSGTVAGTDGVAPGGGGGGTNAAFASGAGAAGKIIVTTYM